MSDCFIVRRGGGLNFNVKAYASELLLPTTAAENTIAVITETPISSYAFSVEEPEAPSEGMVWFSVGTSSSAQFNALKKNELTVSPQSAKQYISDAWVDKTAMIYQDGEWVSWQIFLVKEGVIRTYGFVSVRDGFTHPAKLTQYDGYLYLETSVAGYNGCGATVESIDLTGKTKVFAVIDVVQIGHPASDWWPGLVVGTSINPYNTRIAETKTSKTGLQTLELDVSSIEQKCWIGISCRAYGDNYSRIKIYDIYVQ